MVSVNKKRRSGSYKNALISIDSVDELGCFIEIEIVSDENCIEENKKILYEIAEELELKEIVTSPYDKMIFDRRKVDVK